MSLPAQRKANQTQNKLVSQSAPEKVAEFAKTRIKLKREMNPIVKVENDIVLENTVELTKHLVFCKIKEYENQMNAIKAKIEFEFINKLNSDIFLKKSVEKGILVKVDDNDLKKCQEQVEALEKKEIEKGMQIKKCQDELKKCQDKLKLQKSNPISTIEESEEESAKKPTNANLYFTLA